MNEPERQLIKGEMENAKAITTAIGRTVLIPVEQLDRWYWAILTDAEREQVIAKEGKL